MIDFAHLDSGIGQYWSGLVGLFIVGIYAAQRFNEPTFPNRDALPHTVVPLQYLFLGSAYEKARRTYVVGSLLLYGILLLPGPQITDVLGIDAKSFPPQAWALLVALVLVGLLPMTSIRWVNAIEEWLRRRVHQLFLVPDGTRKTIALLDDAPYQPLPAHLEALPEAQREWVEADLKLRRSTLRYRWARATVLMTCLDQMGTEDHPLKKANFKPFGEDHLAIRSRYRVLAQDIARFRKSYPGRKEAKPQERDSFKAQEEDRLRVEEEESLKAQVDGLLGSIYAYISWGVRQQCNSDRAVIQTLEALGFSISVVEGRRLFDIVAPAVGIVGAITLVFWLSLDASRGKLWNDANNSMLQATISMIAAIAMYGYAAFIAVEQRGARIEQRTWVEGSSKRLALIALRAGALTWLVIVALTVILRSGDTLQSLAALIRWDLAATLPGRDSIEAWSFLLKKMLSALPWFIVGATASAVLASRQSGDVRRTKLPHRVLDGLWVGIGLGLAVVLAQLMQSALAELVKDPDRTPLNDVWIVGFVGLVCGAILGFMVPHACKANVVKPADPAVARALRHLMREAEKTLGSKVAARDFMFEPKYELYGVTPAEAIQYDGYANSVRGLLTRYTARDGEDPQSNGELVLPVVGDGNVVPIVPQPAAAVDGGDSERLTSGAIANRSELA